MRKKRNTRGQRVLVMKRKEKLQQVLEDETIETLATKDGKTTPPRNKFHGRVTRLKKTIAAEYCLCLP